MLIVGTKQPELYAAEIQIAKVILHAWPGVCVVQAACVCSLLAVCFVRERNAVVCYLKQMLYANSIWAWGLLIILNLWDLSA